MTSTPISCSLYDYIEIACIYHYPVLLTLKSGEKIKGIAEDTSINANKTECLKLIEDESKKMIDVPLSDLVQMQSLVNNPHFELVDFHPK